MPMRCMLLTPFRQKCERERAKRRGIDSESSAFSSGSFSSQSASAVAVSACACVSVANLANLPFLPNHWFPEQVMSEKACEFLRRSILFHASCRQMMIIIILCTVQF